MKILFAANRFPYPPYRGDKLKIYHLAKRLAGQHELHLVTFLQEKNDVQYLPELKNIFSEIHLVPLPESISYWNSLMAFFKREPFQVRYFHSKRMKLKTKELLQRHQYDAVHIQHLRLAQYWNDKKDIARILDLPDAYSLYWKRRLESKKSIMKLFARMEYKRVYTYENILKQFEKVLVCSREDQAYLEAAHQINNVAILPNGVDLKTFPAQPHRYAQDEVILFTGNMDYAPNVDAVEYFAKDIFPLILQKAPQARFVIAGQRPVKKVLQLASDKIEITGFVKDLAAIYRRAAIVVAPLRFGAGTQNKVLEAMATGVPVVSHHIGFNGLNIQSGEGVILASDTQQFATACTELLLSESKRKSVGEAGQQVILQQFDWDVIAGLLNKYLIESIQINKRNHE